MRRWQGWKAWKMATFAAFAATVVFASPAAALDNSTTTAQASPSSSTVGTTVVLSATVDCPSDPSGGLGMTFFDGNVLLDTVPVGTDGSSSLSTTFETSGTRTITAAYNGNANCGASYDDDLMVTVSEAPVPPTPPATPCLLLCTGLINYNIGNIHNTVVVH